MKWFSCLQEGDNIKILAKRKKKKIKNNSSLHVWEKGFATDMRGHSLGGDVPFAVLFCFS